MKLGVSQDPILKHLVVLNCILVRSLCFFQIEKFEDFFSDDSAILRHLIQRATDHLDINGKVVFSFHKVQLKYIVFAHFILSF